MKNKFIFFSLLKISFYLLLAGIALTGKISNHTGAYFTSNLTSANSEAETAILDLTTRSGQNNFTPSTTVSGMLPGQSVARDIYVGKTLPSLDLRHKVSYQYVAGDEDFCSQLQLKIWYNHYHCHPSGGYAACRDMRLKYNDLLADLNELTDSDDFIISHPDDQFDQDPSDGTEQWFFYQIFLAADIAEIYQNKTCQFNFVYQARQENSDGSWGYSDEEIIGGSEISSGDWVAPTVAVDSLSPNPTNVNPTLIATALDGYSNISSMYYDIEDGSGVVFGYDDIPLNPQDGAFDGLNETGQIEISISSLADGIYTVYVYALDTAGNEGVSAPVTLTIDDSSQITSFYTSNSPERKIFDDVLNGDFENLGNPLEHWTVEGNATVIDGDSFAQASDIPPGGLTDNHMVKITSTEAPEGDLYYSSIIQEIPNSAKTISFWYNFATYDSIGSDNPGFSVYINEKEVFQIWAEDINYPGGDAAVSGWQKFYYDLNSFDMGEHPILTLAFYSGNKGDDILDSWLYLDKISTNDVYVNADTKLYLRTTTSLTSVNTYFLKGPCDPGAEGTLYTFGDDGFPLTGSTTDNKFCYWSEDEVGNGEDQHQVNLIYDNQAPNKINNLEVSDLGDGEFELDWTAVDPHDPTGNLTAAYYLVKYSEEAIITDDDFDEAADYQAESPRPADELDHLDITGLSPNTEYYFAIKACDAASNCSIIGLSNPTSIGGVGTTDPSVGGTGEVIINELMWMGSEISSADEWLELKNTTDGAINLKDWQIIKKRSDGIEQCMFTFPDIEIGAYDYLVVSEYDKDHSALNIQCPGPKCLVVGEGYTNNQDFSLANNKLQIKLYNGYWVLPTVHLVDTADDGVGAPAKGDPDLYHSMERNDPPGNGADPGNWHLCEDLAAAVYWDTGLTSEHLGTPGVANLSETETSSSIDLTDSPEASSAGQEESSEPTPSPSPTPTPTPSPSPSLEPSPSPSATPTPTPNPSPSSSPEPSLEPSPTPSTEE